MDKRLLEILVCPVNKTPLIYDEKAQRLISIASGLSYPIRDGIPILLAEEASSLTLEEAEKYKQQA